MARYLVVFAGPPGGLIVSARIIVEAPDDPGLAAACGLLTDALNAVAPAELELPTLPAREPGTGPRPGRS